MIQQKLRAPKRTAEAPAGDIAIESDIEMDSDSEIEAVDDDNRDKFKQGKEPMSPELFCKICSWLMV
jgi:hypothetical protein